ncbi:trypsin-like serine protease [Mycobacterium sp. NPDC050551]|uniref:trypsin-like serine peptidase n=1 Tax=Mycobacterium sp. NPDC050551 TaxID=3155407 RepID=UPI00343B830B
MRGSTVAAALRKTAVLAALPAVVLVGCTSPSPAVPQHAEAQGAPAAVARPVSADPRVGAVFVGDGPVHTCTASVLDSARGDLILTAAHCLVDGLDATFVPGFDAAAQGQEPWHLDAVYLDPRWIDGQDPLADYAIARVSRDAGDTPAQQAGGGLALGVAPRPGTPVTVTGYQMGIGGGPIGCRASTAVAAHGFPAVPCEGLVAGVSGAPWVAGAEVTGLVGGLDGGGCDEDLSYSPPFDGHIERLLARAEAGGPADAAPAADDDGC